MDELKFDLVEDESEEKKDIIGDLNEALCDWVLSVLETHGHKAYDVRRGDTYFVFGGYRCSVVSFRLRDVWKGWLFGLWIRGERLLGDYDPTDKVMQFFCQHELTIDKFKPSDSDLLVELDRWTFDWLLDDPRPTDFRGKRVEPSAARKVVALADQVRMHPALSWYGVMGPASPINHCITAYCVKGLVSLRKDELRKELSAKMLSAYMRDRCEVARSLPFVKSCEFEDRGPSWSPRFEVRCVLDHFPDEEEENRILEILPKTYYGGRRFIEESCRVEVVFKDDGKWYQVVSEEA